MIIPLVALAAIAAPNASAGIVGPLPEVPYYPVLASGPADGSVATTGDLTWSYSWNGQTEASADPTTFGTLSQFNCSIDEWPAVDCASSFSATDLADGPHTFAVNATYLGAVSVCEPVPPVDADPCQLELGWVTTGTVEVHVVVDTTAPSLSFLGGITDGSASNQSSQRFPFAAADAGAFTTTCSLDGAPASVCASPFDLTGLGDGAHKLTIVAADANGHSTNIARSFVVDTGAPVAAFTAGPAAGSTISSNHPAFTFAARDLSNVSFTCSFDGAAASPCASPFQKSKLAAGAHVLVVTPTDAVGNIGLPIVRMFTYKPVKRCVKHRLKRSKHGKRSRVCAKYRLASS